MFDGILFQDPKNHILLGSVHTRDYFKFDLLVLLDMIGETAVGSGDGNLRQYMLVYDFRVRVKEEKCKIVVTNFEIVNNQDNLTKTLKDIMGKQHNKSGIPSSNKKELGKLRLLIKDQIKELSEHCAFLKQNISTHDPIIESMLNDDDW